jgi:serpin B
VLSVLARPLLASRHMPTTRTPQPLSHLALALSLALSACGGASSNPHPTPPPPGSEQRSEKLRVTSPAVSGEDAAALAAGNLAFALGMHAQVRAANADKNFIFSQTSMSIALGMLYAGARNQTASQMATALHFTLPPERLHPAFNALDLALAAPAGNEAFRLEIANGSWVQDGFTALPSFLDTLAENYGAGLFVEDFATAPEPAREKINGWVAEQTEDQIKDLFPPGSINSMTVLVLANAVFFHGDWVKPFESKSGNGTFHAPGGDVSVPMMRGDHNGLITSGTGWSAARLDYVGDTTSMVVVVPDAGTFDAFEQGLTVETLAPILSPTSGSSGDIVLPRFKFKTATNLKDPLVALGMTDAFGQGADFSGIDGQGGLVVQAVLHQATIAVDEKGTTASAATGISVGTTSVPLTLRADRPFLFFIVHRPTGAVLFQGRVLDPSK